MASVTVSFTLDDRNDRDLLSWLDSLPKRGKSEAIRRVLRTHLGHRGVTLGDIYEAIQNLKRHGLAVVAQNISVPPDEEPPDVATALDKLGL